MKARKKLLVISLLSIGFLILTSSCAVNTQYIPVYKPLAEPPVKIAVEQLLSDYFTDVNSADAKYKGVRFLFSDIKVEALSITVVDSASDPNISIINYYIEFRLKYEESLPTIKEGYILDIIGNVKGLFDMGNPHVIVEDCWISIVEGDTEGDINDWEY